MRTYMTLHHYNERQKTTFSCQKVTLYNIQYLKQNVHHKSEIHHWVAILHDELLQPIAVFAQDLWEIDKT